MSNRNYFLMKYFISMSHAEQTIKQNGCLKHGSQTTKKRQSNCIFYSLPWWSIVVFINTVLVSNIPLTCLWRKCDIWEYGGDGYIIQSTERLTRLWAYLSKCHSGKTKGRHSNILNGFGGGDEDGGEVSHHIDSSKLGLKMLTMSLKFEGENANLVTTHQQNVHIYCFEKIYNKQASSNNNKGRKKDFPYFRRHSILLITWNIHILSKICTDLTT